MSTVLNPYYVSGFCDAESSFSVLTVKGRNGESTTARLVFKISLHIREKYLLEGIARFFGVGSISANATSCQYIVQSVSSLGPIISHFESYPLITKKRFDF